MPVALRIRRGRAGDALASEGLRDRVQAHPTQIVPEDPLHHRRRTRIDLQPVETLPVRSFAWVGVRPRISQLVPIRWPPTEKPPLGSGLRCHRGTNADLDAGLRSPVLIPPYSAITRS